MAALEEQLAGMDDYLRQHEAQVGGTTPPPATTPCSALMPAPRASHLLRSHSSNLYRASALGAHSPASIPTTASTNSSNIVILPPTPHNAQQRHHCHIPQGPLFGGQHLNGTDCSLAPKLYHAVVALKHFKGWELPARFTALHK